MQNFITFGDKEYPLKSWSSLEDCARWISYQIPPVESVYQPLFPNHTSNKDSRNELFYHLIKGNLEAIGEECLIKVVRISDDGFPYEEPRIIKKHVKFYEKTEINRAAWSVEDYFWDSDALLPVSSDIFDEDNYSITKKGYTCILISTEDLLCLFPMSGKELILASGSRKHSYTTPFIKLMQEAIEHFQITEKKQVGTKVLIPWFEERLRALGEDAPNNKAKMMATFVRSPEAQKGGNKKNKLALEPANGS